MEKKQASENQADKKQESEQTEKKQSRYSFFRWLKEKPGRVLSKIFYKIRKILEQILFSSLTRRIVILNLAALCVLVISIMYLNRFRDGLIDAKMENLRLQGRIVAGAIAASATIDTGKVHVESRHNAEKNSDDRIETWYFPIDADRVTSILRRVISPAETRAKIYDRNGDVLLDSRQLYSDGRISSSNLPPIDSEKPNIFWRAYEWGSHILFGADAMPFIGAKNIAEQMQREVAIATQGHIKTSQFRNRQGDLVVSVAVPIQRYHAVLGVLQLSTTGADIDEIVSSERYSIVKIFSIVALVMLILSLLLAYTVANPLRRLSEAAQRVRFGTKNRIQIPDYSFRRDEIGHLSTSISQMTDALYTRIEAIESFAADVSHELKNPLTSLRSAVEALPLASTEKSRNSLLEIIEHDVRRLDRLITDISGASRLDAELAREDAQIVDLKNMLGNLVRTSREVHKSRRQVVIDLTIAPLHGSKQYLAKGYELRLGQVISNLIENARSFVPQEGGRIHIYMKKHKGFNVITIVDNGPGIKAEDIDRIFERFYTDRPGTDSFGQNSGLGLSISRQIVEAHGGTLKAENMYTKKPPYNCVGARFIIQLPVVIEKKEK